MASSLWPYSKSIWEFVTGRTVKCQRATVSKFAQAHGCISQINLSQKEPVKLRNPAVKYNAPSCPGMPPLGGEGCQDRGEKRAVSPQLRHKMASSISLCPTLAMFKATEPLNGIPPVELG